MGETTSVAFGTTKQCLKAHRRTHMGKSWTFIYTYQMYGKDLNQYAWNRIVSQPILMGSWPDTNIAVCAKELQSIMKILKQDNRIDQTHIDITMTIICVCDESNANRRI